DRRRAGDRLGRAAPAAPLTSSLPCSTLLCALRAVRRRYMPGSATWDGHPTCPPALLHGERGCGRPRRQPSVRGKEPVLVMDGDGFFCGWRSGGGEGRGEE